MLNLEVDLSRGRLDVRYPCHCDAFADRAEVSQIKYLL